jgi:hypothetical protein
VLEEVDEARYVSAVKPLQRELDAIGAVDVKLDSST